MLLSTAPSLLTLSVLLFPIFLFPPLALFLSFSPLASHSTTLQMENPFTANLSPKEKYNYIKKFKIENWYESMLSHTFVTSFIPLTKTEGISEQIGG
jgi:hypothetical protein